MKTIIATTNDIILDGVSDFIGAATVCIDVPEIDATKATKLYEIDATARQFPTVGKYKSQRDTSRKYNSLTNSDKSGNPPKNRTSCVHELSVKA